MTFFLGAENSEDFGKCVYDERFRKISNWYMVICRFITLGFGDIEPTYRGCNPGYCPFTKYSGNVCSKKHSMGFVYIYLHENPLNYPVLRVNRPAPFFWEI